MGTILVTTRKLTSIQSESDNLIGKKLGHHPDTGIHCATVTKGDPFVKLVKTQANKRIVRVESGNCSLSCFVLQKSHDHTKFPMFDIQPESIIFVGKILVTTRTLSSIVTVTNRESPTGVFTGVKTKIFNTKVPI